MGSKKRIKVLEDEVKCLRGRLADHVVQIELLCQSLDDVGRALKDHAHNIELLKDCVSLNYTGVILNRRKPGGEWDKR